MKDQDEKWRKLYTYWESIPLIGAINLDEAHQLTGGSIRSFILQFMRDGVEDDYSRENNLDRRHGFSIRELYNHYLERNPSDQVTIQNFHHHINKLLDGGFVKEITTILEGRHHVRYFGRTAKIFDNPHNPELEEFYRNSIIDPFKVLIRQLQPQLCTEEIDETMDLFLVQLRRYYLRIYTWIKQHYRALYTSKINILQFISLSTNFARGDSEFQKTRDKIMHWLHLDDLDSYPPMSPGEVATEETL